MKHEINAGKMNITQEQRHTCLEIIQKLAYSTNIEEYTNNLAMFREADVEPVYEYFLNSWDCIKEEWVVGLKQSCHFNNHTNNRLESINQKFKQVISRFSTLPQFFEELELVLSSLRQQRDARLTAVIMKRPTIPYEPASPQYRYAQLLTPHAFQVVLEQTEKIIFSENICENTVTIRTSCGQTSVRTVSCTCQFSAMNHLPCRHTCELHKHLGIDMYFEDAVAQRWCISFYKTTLFTDQSENSDPGPVPIYVQPRPTILSVPQRYKAAFTEVQNLATMASEGSMEKFCTRLSVLQNLVQIWEQDHDVTVTDITVTTCSGPVIEGDTMDAALECVQTNQRTEVTHPDQRTDISRPDQRTDVSRRDQRMFTESNEVDALTQTGPEKLHVDQVC